MPSNSGTSNDVTQHLLPIVKTTPQTCATVGLWPPSRIVTNLLPFPASINIDTSIHLHFSNEDRTPLWVGTSPSTHRGLNEATAIGHSCKSWLGQLGKQSRACDGHALSLSKLDSLLLLVVSAPDSIFAAPLLISQHGGVVGTLNHHTADECGAPHFWLPWL